MTGRVPEKLDTATAASVAVAFLGEGAAAVVDVGNSDDFDARQRRFGLHVTLAHDAESDAAKLNAIVGRNWFGRFLGSGFAHGERGGGNAGTLHEWRRLMGMV